VAPTPAWLAIADAATAERFASLTSHALAEAMLRPGLVDAADAAASRLQNRFRRANGVRWARLAAEAGVEVVCLKGLAVAHLLYPPDLRWMSDADLLVRRTDRDRLIAVFEAAGLAFIAPRARSPWGFVGDASFLPMASADGAANVDLHVHPDAWPVHRALSTERVFAESFLLETPEGAIRTPCLTHILLLAATHAARDLFGPAAVKNLVDASMLLRGHGPALDWPTLRRLAAEGAVAAPVRAFFALLDRLLGAAGTPEDLRAAPAGWRRAAFERVARSLADLEPSEPSLLARLERECLVAAEPAVAARRAWLRLAGLARPNRGLPP